MARTTKTPVDADSPASRLRHARMVLGGSNQLLSSLFQLSPVAMFVVDPDTMRLILVNEMALQLFGYEQEEMLGKTVEALTYPGDTIVTPGNLAQQRQESDFSYSVEKRYLRKNGSAFWASTRISFLSGARNDRDLLLGTIYDISGRKMTEQKLRRKLQELEKLMDVVPAAVWIAHDRDCTVITGNALANRMFEAAEDENVSATAHPQARRLLDANGRELRPDELPMQLAARDNREIRNMELRVTMASGRTITILGSAIPLRDAEGGSIGSIAAFQDITDRKQHDQELREQDLLFREMSSMAHVGGWQFDPRTGEGNWTEEVARIHGVEPSDTTSARYGLSFFHGEDRKKIEEAVKRASEAGERYDLVLRLRTADGEEKWVRTICDPVLEGGKVIKMRGAIQDITEFKRQEEIIENYARQMETSMTDTLLAVSNMVEQRDPYTAGHERRVGLLAADIGRELGWDEKKCRELEMIGLVHDIGKIGVPVEILTKPGRLSAIEYELVKRHADRGYEILKDVKFPLPIADIIHQHHERMDGSGYPRGLIGSEILPEARVLMVADVVESISSHRPYRPALGMEVALREITDRRGTLYDETVVDAFLRLVDRDGYQLPE